MPVLYFGSFFASMIREVQNKSGDNATYWKGYTIYGDEPIYNISYYSPQTNMSHLKATTYLTQTNTYEFIQSTWTIFPSQDQKNLNQTPGRSGPSSTTGWRDLFESVALRVVVERPLQAGFVLLGSWQQCNKWKIVQACNLESFGPCLHRFRGAVFAPPMVCFWFYPRTLKYNKQIWEILGTKHICKTL